MQIKYRDRTMVWQGTTQEALFLAKKEHSTRACFQKYKLEKLEIQKRKVKNLAAWIRAAFALSARSKQE